MGKTRLLTDFARAQGLDEQRVLLVSARPGDERVPCALLSRWLRAILAALQGVDLPPGVKRELCRLLPELGDAEPVAGDLQKARFVNALDVLLAAVATHGLSGMVLDDMHFADSAGLEMALHLNAVPGLSWLVAGRGAELPAQAQAFITERGDALQAETLTLGPLTQPQVHEFVASLDLPEFDRPDLAQALFRRSGGSPLFLIETLKALWTQREPAGAALALRAAIARAELQLYRADPKSLDASLDGYELACQTGRTDLMVRFALPMAGQLGEARRADEAVSLLLPMREWTHTHLNEARRCQFENALALALDQANRLDEALAGHVRAAGAALAQGARAAASGDGHGAVAGACAPQLLPARAVERGLARVPRAGPAWRRQHGPASGAAVDRAGGWHAGARAVSRELSAAHPDPSRPDAARLAQWRGDLTLPLMYISATASVARQAPASMGSDDAAARYVHACGPLRRRRCSTCWCVK